MNDLKRQLCVLAVIVLVSASVIGAGTAIAAEEQTSTSVPMSISTQYIGNTTAADHALTLQITVAPTEQTLNTTQVDVKSTESAFISPSSIDTIVSTQDGRQVVSRSNSGVGDFKISKLHPGESVTIKLRLYPHQLVPDGESLATVAAETQFEANQQVVSDQVSVSPDLRPTAVSIVSSPSPSRLMSGIVGGIGGGIFVGGLAVLTWWRRKSRLQQIAQSIESTAVSNETRQSAHELQQIVGRANSASRQSDTQSIDTASSQGDESDGTEAEIELVDDLD